MRKLLLISLIVCALLIGCACAADDTLPPRLPCTYFGGVTINGAPAPIGTVITAHVAGVDLIGATTVTTAGKYEYLSVQNNFGPTENPQVAFYINDVQATQIRTFEKGAAIKVDLTFGSIEVPTTAPTTIPTSIPTILPTAEYKTTKVIGSIHGVSEPVVKSVVITPPTGTVPWDLDMSNPNNNQITIGSVHVVANCDYTLSIQGSTGGYLIGEAGQAMSLPTLKNPVLVWNGTAFRPIEDWQGSTHITSLVIYKGNAGTVDIPIRLQQILVPGDEDKISPTIVLGYVVTTT